VPSLKVGSSLTAIALIAICSVPASGEAGRSAPAPQPRSHGNLVVGTVTSVDDRARSFVVRATDGKDTRLYWNTATGITGGSLEGGLRVRVKWMTKQGKNWATSVEVIRQQRKEPGGMRPARTPDPGTRALFFATASVAPVVHAPFMGESLSWPA